MILNPPFCGAAFINFQRGEKRIFQGIALLRLDLVLYIYFILFFVGARVCSLPLMYSPAVIISIFGRAAVRKTQHTAPAGFPVSPP